LVGLFFGFKGYLRERRLISAERSRQVFFDLFVKARNYMAAHEWNRARDIWEQVLRKDADNVIARIELSACLEKLGDEREALRVLDATRASSRANWEVLFRAADLNRKLGNNTGAADNIALIVQDSPSRRALEIGRDIAEEMGRLDDAVEYQNELDKLGYDVDKSTDVRTRLTFAQLTRGAPDETTLRATLESFVKRHPTFTPGLERLAELELARGKVEDAAELFVKAAKASKGDLTKWLRVIDLWLNSATGDFNRRVDRALSAARAAAQDTRGRDRLRAEFVMAQTLLAVNKAEEARKVLDGVPSIAEREGAKLTDDLTQEYVRLKGLCLSRLGLAKDTTQLWQQLVEPSAPVRVTQASLVKGPVQEPSPALSTP
jgi:thioredoxin-like negative regulator of GroEL